MRLFVSFISCLPVCYSFCVSTLEFLYMCTRVGRHHHRRRGCLFLRSSFSFRFQALRNFSFAAHLLEWGSSSKEQNGHDIQNLGDYNEKRKKNEISWLLYVYHFHDQGDLSQNTAHETNDPRNIIHIINQATECVWWFVCVSVCWHMAWCLFLVLVL